MYRIWLTTVVNFLRGAELSVDRGKEKYACIKIQGSVCRPLIQTQA